MPSTYTTNLGIEKIATGEQSGTWGTTTNTNLDLIDEAVNGIVTVTLAGAGSSGSPNTLAITNGASSDGRNKYIEFNDGGDLGGTAFVQLTPNDAEKIVHIRNSLSASRSILIFQGTYNASNDFEIPNGADVVLKFDGAGAGAVVSDVNVNLTPTKLTTATADIDGGTIDDTVIGGTTTATGSFTTLQADTSLNVDGTVTADGLTVDGDAEISSSSTKLDLMETDTTDLNTRIRNNAGDVQIQTLNDAKTSATTRLNIDHSTGDISFYEDTGTTPKLFWDASAESLGIGTSSPSTLLDVLNNSATAYTSSSIPEQFRVFNNNTTAGVSAGIALGTGNTGTAYCAIEALRVDGSNQHLTFKTEGSATVAERMRIDSSGNVGIGTTSPDFPLEVYKDTTAEVAIGTSNGGNARLSFYESDSSTKEFFINYDGANNTGEIGTSGEANAIKIARDSGNVDIAANLAFNSGYGSAVTAYGVRVWVNFQGNAVSGGNNPIRGSGNVSTVGDNGVGNHYVNFSTALPDNNYSVVTGVTRDYDAPSNNAESCTGDLETGRFNINTYFGDSATNNDWEGVHAMVVR